jgi:DNA-binding winged helix-turn-helix (wHTH) protein
VKETRENRENSPRSAVIRFGPFSIDATQRRLLRGDVVLHVTPKAFDLLHLLASEAPRVVSKPELHERLWPGTFVSDSSLTGLVKELRRVLEDDDSDAPIIRTVHRVGYACAQGAVSRRREKQAWHWLVLRGRRIVLQQGQNVIGRDPASDVWIDLPGVSRRHARIMIEGATVLLEDQGSKNGTTVGDARVETRVALADGDRISFGSVAGVYRTSGAGMSTETRGHSRGDDGKD